MINTVLNVVHSVADAVIFKVHYKNGQLITDRALPEQGEYVIVPISVDEWGGGN